MPQQSAVAPAPPAPNEPAAPAAPAPAREQAEQGDPIRGVAAAIAANMSRSLAVPTATSFRDVPAKLLEVNRKVINGYRSRSGTGKVSFTHLIGYAVVRAIADAVPVMRNAYAEDAAGKPRLIRNESVNLGIAVDVDKGDGTRSLVVPVIRDADQLDFAGFLAAYEELIRKVRANKLAVEDFQGANVSLTNPGTIGTVQSVAPPDAWPGRHRRRRPHRLPGRVRGRRPGEPRLARVQQGRDADQHLRPPHHPGRREAASSCSGCTNCCSASTPSTTTSSRLSTCRTRRSSGDPTSTRSTTTRRCCRSRCRSPRSSGSTGCAVTSSPISIRCTGKSRPMPPEVDPLTYGLTIWDLDREFLTGGIAGSEKMPLGELLGVFRDAYCRTVGIEYMHIQDTQEQRWIQSKVEGVHHSLDKDRKHRILERLNAAEAFEKFLATKYVGTKRYGLEGAESAIPILDEVISAAADSGLDSCVLGMAHRGPSMRSADRTPSTRWPRPTGAPSRNLPPGYRRTSRSFNPIVTGAAPTCY